MVASISARKSIAAAKAYYRHFEADEYYREDAQPNGRWAGRAAKILDLDPAIDSKGFQAALEGRCPRTFDPLVKPHSKRSPGWDITLSAPKSVSALWGLTSSKALQTGIARAQELAAEKTIEAIEDEFAWCRRGKAGKSHEKTAGLLTALFHHHTSRNLDPQLHTHIFIMNLAPRKDGTWGGLQSKSLYRAQKEIGKLYRENLKEEILELGLEVTPDREGFRIAGITREDELAFSSRRREMLDLIEMLEMPATSRNLERAALMTRDSKKRVPLNQIRAVWRERHLERAREIDRIIDIRRPKDLVSAQSFPKMRITRRAYDFLQRAARKCLHRKIGRIAKTHMLVVAQAGMNLLRWIRDRPRQKTRSLQERSLSQ